MIAIMGIVTATATAGQSMKENTTITVVIDTIALGPTTENIAAIGNIEAIERIEVIETIVDIAHTTGVTTAINAFAHRAGSAGCYFNLRAGLIPLL